MSDNGLVRRDALALMAAFGAMAGRPAAAAQTDASPQEKLRKFIMMRGALDDRLVLSWQQGQYFGLVEGETTPLCGLINATLSRYRRRNDGGYDGARGELSFITDLDSGKVVTQIRNPYTGAMVDTPVRGYPPSVVHINPDLRIRINENNGEKLENTTSAPIINGPDLWMTEVNAAKTQLPGGRISFYNEMIGYHAKAKDFDRAGAARVACDTSFTSLVSWRSWLQMGDRPGQMLAVGNGSYVTRISELPTIWLEQVQRLRPEILVKPIEFLAEAWAKLA